MRIVLRTLLVIVLFVAAGVLLLNLAASRTAAPRGSAPPAVGTSGSVEIQRARERGAEIGEKAAVATQKVNEAVTDAALTTKIKAKMALDDSVRAREINVTTDGSTVTLTGTVRSNAERDRAIALARETVGVTQVVDHLQVIPSSEF